MFPRLCGETWAQALGAPFPAPSKGTPRRGRRIRSGGKQSYSYCQESKPNFKRLENCKNAWMVFRLINDWATRHWGIILFTCRRKVRGKAQWGHCSSLGSGNLVKSSQAGFPASWISNTKVVHKPLRLFNLGFWLNRLNFRPQLKMVQTSLPFPFPCPPLLSILSSSKSLIWFGMERKVIPNLNPNRLCRR